MQQKWLSLFALMTATSVVFLDQTILPVALPTIQREFGASNLALQWCVNAYLLAISMFVLAAGKLGDRIGHRKALFYGMIVFVVSSIFCGLSQEVEWLIGARAIQGLGAALMFPAQTSIMADLFPPSQRGRAIGLNVSISSLFLIVGPLLGGYLTEAASWRWIFWINIPIALIGLPLMRLFLPVSRPTPVKIDLLGFLFFALFAGSFTLIFMEGEEWGWLSLPVSGTTLIATLSLIFLFLREKKAPHPFLDLSLFKHSTFSAINISISIVQLVLMITVFRAVYFQTALDYSPVGAGWLTFISACPTLFMPHIAGYLSDKITPRLPIALGYILLMSSFFYFGFFPSLTLTPLIIGLLAFGCGIPLIFTPSYSSAMNTIPATKMGTAFGIVSTCRQFSASMGIAWIGLLWNSIEARNNDQEAFGVVHLVLAFLLLVAFGVTFVLHRRKSTHNLPSSPGQGWD